MPMILRFIIAAVLLYFVFRIVKRLLLPSGKKVKPLPGDKNDGTKGEDLVEDPLCHTYVPISEAHKLNLEGKPLYFCSKNCLEQYQIQSKAKREEE
jgi:YHS domain-containing protein